MIAIAKMIGITPLIATLIGMCVFCPPYCFLPTTRLAYWIGILLSDSFMKTMKPIIRTNTTSTRGTTRAYFESDLICSNIERTLEGPLETIPAKRIMEIPLPIPFSLILLPSHTTSCEPATNAVTITIAANTPEAPSVYLTAP